MIQNFSKHINNLHHYIRFYIYIFFLIKAEAKTDSNVKFVDVINNFEAYIRCDCQESAKKIAEENRWPKTTQLKGKHVYSFKTMIYLLFNIL